MKPSTLALIGSLAANAVLLGFFATRPQRASRLVGDYFSPATVATNPTDPAMASGTKPAGNPSLKNDGVADSALWAGLYSSDLRQFGDRLRAAGFPPAKIRALLVAEIEHRLNIQLNALAQTVDIAYWRPDPFSSFANPEFLAAENQIARQKTDLLRAAMAEHYFDPASDQPTAAQQRQFGNLSASTIELIRSINNDYSALRSQIEDQMRVAVLPEDREKLAFLEREKRADLAAILTPEQLAEYEIRSSPTHSRLVSRLTIINASEEEFRTLYGIIAPMYDALYPAYNAAPTTRERSQEIQQEVADRIKAALGAERYAEYARASSPDYYQLNRLVQSDNVSPAAVLQAFDVRTRSGDESLRIYSDPTLSRDQKAAALNKLAHDARAQLQTLLGATAAGKYITFTSWLTNLEHGRAVVFSANGESVSVRELPPAPKGSR